MAIISMNQRVYSATAEQVPSPVPSIRNIVIKQPIGEPNRSLRNA